MLKRLLPGMFVLIIVSTGTVLAQRNANIGIFAGTAYYLGDINPNRHFYRPSLSLGAIYRYNLNTRYAIRGNAYYTNLSGSDLDFPETLHPDRPFSPAAFNTSLIDLALQVEYNFLPFTPNVGKWAYTPYIATGISGALILSSDVAASNFLSFPFSAGLKVNLTSRISAGAEWSFRKTFSDTLDGLENPSGTRSFIHNNDWYSSLGVFITFKFFNFEAKCPAYM
jgi:opacity protein-like surface antigen